MLRTLIESRFTFILLGLAILVMPAFFSVGATPQVIVEPAVTIDASSVDGLQFTLRTPELALDETGQIDISGLVARIDTIGAPALPYYSTLIALPPAADATVQVSISAEKQFEANVLPAPSLADPDGLAAALEADSGIVVEDYGLAYNADPAIYDVDADYPTALYSVSEPMYMRDLRVVQITLYPVHANPVAGTVTQAQEMQVSIQFDGADFTDLQPARSAALSNVQKQVLNYDSAETGGWYSLPNAVRAGTETALPVGSTAFKIAIDTDGIYELSYTDLQLAGMPVDAVNPNKLEMMYRGEPVAFEFVGNTNNDFEFGEAVRFYGWRYDVDYTDPLYNTTTEHYPNRIERQHILGPTNMSNTTGGTNYFWLWEGDSSTSITTRANLASNTPVSNVRVAVNVEGDNAQHPTFTSAWPTFDNEPDSWYWSSLTTSGVTKNITLPHPDPSGSNAIALAEVNSTATGSHQAIMTLGTASGSEFWGGYNDKNVTASVNANELINGNNSVTVRRTTAGSIRLQRIMVTYDRLLISDNDQMLFKDLAAGSPRYDVSGFSIGDVNDIIVWDVTDVNNPEAIALSGGDVIGAGPYTYRVGSNHSAGTRFAIANSASVKSPLAVTAYTVPDLDPVDGAQWLAISHGDFVVKTQELAAYRQSTVGGSMTTHVVDVADVINVYGYGLPVPKAIQDYVLHALSWSTAPDYLLLVGDASVNPRGWFCATCIDYVPTNLLFVDRYRGQVPTDHPYATPDGLDQIPDIAVGRMAVNTVAQMDNWLAKTYAYEAANIANTPWTRDTLFVADNLDDGGDFCTANTATDNDHISGAYDSAHLCLDDYYPDPPPNPIPPAMAQAANDQLRADMKTALDAGVGIYNYRGHGAIRYWAREDNTSEYLLSMDEPHIADFWENTGKPTVIISADCLDGNFSDLTFSGGTYVDVPALSETFLETQDVATAAHWSSTGLGLNGEHTFLHQGFYDGLIVEGHERIGDAIVYAKTSYVNANAGHISEIYSFTLQGDPALRMPTPNAPTAISLSHADSAENSPFSVYLILIAMVLTIITLRVVLERREVRKHNAV
jgi:hypothetical protein